MGNLISESQQIIADCYATLPGLAQKVDRKIQELVISEKVIELQLRLTRARVRSNIRDQWKEILTRVKSIWPAIKAALKEAYTQSVSAYRRVRKVTGLAHIPDDIEQQLQRYLTDTRRQIDSLPYVYQRLFRFEPIADERFFIGREDEQQRFQHYFAAFKAGHHVTLALVGESGSGRTSLLNMVHSRIFVSYPVYRLHVETTFFSMDDLLAFLKEGLRIPDAENMDALETALNALPSRPVISLENIHHMFLRVPGGFDVIKRLLLLISQTAGNVFWVVSCGQYSWQYLNRIIHIKSHFHHTITLGGLDATTIEHVILKRHRVSGYQLEFQVPDELKGSRRFKRLKLENEQQALLKDIFFEQLDRLAAGNLTVAILFWMKAVKEIREDRFIIAPFIDFDLTFLAQTSGQDLFSYLALLQHETLTVEQHAKVFHQDIPQSQRQLRRLVNKGILVEKQNGYQIHYLLYRPVVKTLRLHNILH